MLRKLILLLALCGCLPVMANPIDLEWTDMRGNALKLSDYRGKWVVLNYWATWCPPCLEEIPELVLYHESHKDRDGVVIGIDMESLSPKLLQQFVDENFITYPIVPLVDNMPAFDNISSFPTTYLIDPDGMVVAKQVGSVTADIIEQFIQEYRQETTVQR